MQDCDDSHGLDFLQEVHVAVEPLEIVLLNLAALEGMSHRQGLVVTLMELEIVMMVLGGRSRLNELFLQVLVARVIEIHVRFPAVSLPLALKIDSIFEQVHD